VHIAEYVLVLGDYLHALLLRYALKATLKLAKLFAGYVHDERHCQQALHNRLAQVFYVYPQLSARAGNGGYNARMVLADNCNDGALLLHALRIGRLGIYIWRYPQT
jgi:hypothetical protein